MNDQQIVKLLREGSRSKAFVKLYKGYPAVEKLILSKGGSKTEAQDVFQNALIIFYKKTQSNDFELTSSISTYLYSVSRYLWKDQLKKSRNALDLDYPGQTKSDADEELKAVLVKESRFKKMEEVLAQLGEKCIQLLQLFYYKGLSMKSIAEQLEFKSESVAKNQKYKCIERAKHKLKTLSEKQAN